LRALRCSDVAVPESSVRFLLSAISEWCGIRKLPFAMATAHTAFTRKSVVARLCDASGRHYPLHAAATRIGRLPDNDIVLNDDEVSRHHAVIIDTGGSFVITDLKSANGVQVQHRQLHPSATLADGDRISICGHEFTFEIQREEIYRSTEPEPQ
jgi:pSer/pThr/pTyr-binding forkhead associated (FHA) protein